LPENLIIEVEKCKTNLDVRKVGIEFAVAQSKELLAADVPFLHYYSMGKSDNIHAIASELF
jgi:methylenetetrahydrofolate reductase (NADPH)